MEKRRHVVERLRPLLPRGGRLGAFGSAYGHARPLLDWPGQALNPVLPGPRGQRTVDVARSPAGGARLLQDHLLQVAMTAGPFMMDHLFLSAATTVKHVGLPPLHVVQ
jgi:hypothetical protein